MSRVHKNPGQIVLLGNPPRRRQSVERLYGDIEGQREELMSNHVLAIVYRHVADGKMYAHTFGTQMMMVEIENGVAFVNESGRVAQSGIQMIALGDKAMVLRAKDGHNISEDF